MPLTRKTRFQRYKFLLILIGVLVVELSFAQVNYSFPGMQAQTAPIPTGGPNSYPKANDTAVTSNQIFINDFANNTGLLDSAFIKNIVTFRINEALPRMLIKPFTAVLTYKVFFTGKNGLVYDSVRSNLSLTINYDTTKASVFNTSNSLVFYNGYKVKVKVLSITTTDTSLLKAMEVDNTIVYHNYYKFSCASSTVTDLATPGPANGVGIPDELPVTWSSKTGVSGYDLEWTYIDSSAIQSGKYGVLNSAAFYNAIFLNNATRVNLTDTFTRYYIPLLFEKQGVLYSRIRSFQNVPNGRRMESDWGPSIVGFGFSGHQTNLNWQSSTSFAEEGKRKSVVQYYDGSLRNRQTVTKDNTTRTTIVAEKMYDNQGREAIQVLPAPTLKTIIQYTAQFNSINNGEYDKTHFDKNLAGYVCGSGADSMSNNSGSSLYYSPSNPDKNNAYNQFIPNAFDYPYSETRYLPDNTGRITLQGGVGKMHQIGNGHETRYYYGSPDQTELDGLFGTEVGLASHYFKNYVRDANGQYSVSYIDMHGRTIATALAGNLPDSVKLDYLSNKKDSVLTKTITDSTNNVIKGLTIESSKSIVITRQDNVTFSYTLPATTLTINNCNNQPVNYNCLYDLSITLTDHCNNQTFGGAPYVYSQSNIPSASAVSFTKSLPEGEYTVTKILTVNQASYEYYRDSVFMKNNLCKTITTLTSSYIDSFKAVHNGCGIPTCASCSTALGTYTAFRSNLIKQNGWDSTAISASMEASMSAEFLKQQADCSALCLKETNKLDQITSDMLQDMNPNGGQYADTLNIDQWSIFYPTTAPLYQSPLNNYLDETGKPDSLIVNGVKVPARLLNKVDFINNFKPSWANALLGSHPEYGRLQYVTTNVTRASYDWDNDFNATQKFKDAYAKGYLNPTSNPAFVNKFTNISLPYSSTPAYVDSFFYKNSSQLSSMNTKLNQYSLFPNQDTSSIWSLSSEAGYCNSDTNSVCIASNKKFPFPNTTTCTGSADMAWRAFSGFYESSKNQLLITFITNGSPVSSALNSAFNSGAHTSRFTTDPAAAINKVISNVNPTDTSAAGRIANVAAINTYQRIQYDSTCRNYSTVWWAQLATCTTLKLLPDSANIINNLISICRKGSDSKHPYGSSSISPDSSFTYNNFDTVINFYIAKYNSTHSDSIYKQSCNGEMILFPKPYAAAQIASDRTLYGSPDSATCNRVSNLYKGYQLANGVYTSFSNYMAVVYNTTIPDSTLNALLSRCALVPGLCTNLTTPIVLPPALQSGVTNYCIACDKMISLNSQFTLSYPGKIPTSTYSSDTTQTAINSLYENFMNNQTGFSRHAADYLTFLSQCSGYTTNNSDTCSQFTFQKDIGGAGDVINSIKGTFDGGRILAGATSVFGHGGVDALLTKTDSKGALLWSKTYGGTSDDVFKSVIQTPDSGFLAVGTTNSYHSAYGEIFVVRTNKNGDVVWSKGFSNHDSYYGDNGFDAVYVPSDSGYAISSEHALSAIEVIKLSKTGTLNWAKNFNPTDGSGYCGGILMDGDTIVCSGFFFSGEASEISNRSLIFKLKRTTGSIIWRQSYTVDSTVIDGNYAQAICKTPNGYRLNLSVRYQSVYAYSNVILDLDKNYAPRWSKKLPVVSGGIVLSGLNYGSTGIQTTDGGYLSLSTNGQNTFVKLDSLGNVKWGNTIIRPGYQQMTGLIQNSDSSYMAGGQDQSGAFFIKTDKNGKTSCYDSSFLTPAISLSASIRTFTVYDSSFLNYPSPDISVTAIPVIPGIVMICSKNGCSNPNYLTGLTLCNNIANTFMPQVAITPAPTPCADSTTWAASRATNVYNFYSDSVKGSFQNAYLGKCLQAAKTESLTLKDSISEYQYTLYYYDQAGNLVKTVPPAGVVRTYNPTWISQVKTARANGTLLAPAHTLVSEYTYNTLNLAVAQSTPDAKVSNFWYDRLGRLVLSENAKQLSEGTNYSYTLYDPIGRITEVGQINAGVGAVTTNTTKVASQWATWLANNATNRYQITSTVYDLAGSGIIAPWLVQNPSTLRNRVSYSSITPGQKGTALNYTTYYNYDIAGNVSSLLQDYSATSAMGVAGQEYKRVDYSYDLISGKVNSVAYQSGKPDAFMHMYQYDAENRLTDVYSSADSVTVEHEAHYVYYKHGPLARVLVGANQVQGLDYAYTLQGWLKAVNGSTLNPVNDMGQDGNIANQSQQYIGQDAYGFSLHYFEGDYYPINGSSLLTTLKTQLGTNYKGLYNGNISSMAVNIGILNNPKLYNYKYDQLNRITGMDVLNGTNTGLNLWTNGLTATNDYQERSSYDPNGNILTYTRNGYGSTQSMDNLTYNYRANTNKLTYITDAVASGNYPNDIDNQSAGNYSYDSIGNLLTDVQAGITANMTWSVYGKLLTISSKSVSYQYDAAGNRISKTASGTNTWYVRDAQGNVLSTYSGSSMILQEQDLYGSSRLGLISSPAALAGTAQFLDALGSGTIFTFTRGKKLFELPNHLGNVLATVSDKKFGTQVPGIPSQVSYYTADVKTAQDYYPFGMQEPGRTFTSSSTYRYGFNGKEKSDDINGTAVDYDYGARIYDSRTGKFFSVDPLQEKYPELTPYQFGSNSPIAHVDLDGLEKYYYALTFNAKSEPILTQTKIEDFSLSLPIGQHWDIMGHIHTDYGSVKNPYPEYYISYSWNSYVSTEVFAFPTTDHVDIKYENDPATIDQSQLVNDVNDAIESYSNWNDFRQGFAGGIGHRSLTEKIRGKLIETESPTAKTNVGANSAHGGNEEAANSNTSAQTVQQPAEAYNRLKHYGKTPTKVDRKVLNASKDQVVDHTTPLVKHYFEGDGQNSKPGYMMSKSERKDFAKDRTKMKLQSKKDSQKQGGELSNYSKKQKKKYGL